MADTFSPWERYQDLRPERLGVIAGVFRDVRETIAKLHDPSAGDGPWSFGCRAYERTCFALTKAAERYDWLTILPDKERPLRFTFAIGDTPFRFYRGDPEEPPSRYLLVTFEEYRQQQLCLDLNCSDQPGDALLRFAVETDAAGRVKSVTVIELNQLRIVSGQYQVPLEAQPVVVPLRARPIESPAPVVEPIEEEAETKPREERNVSGL